MMLSEGEERQKHLSSDGESTRLSAYQIVQDPPHPLCTVGIIGTNEADIAASTNGLIQAGFAVDQVRLLVIRNLGENHFDAYLE